MPDTLDNPIAAGTCICLRCGKKTRSRRPARNGTFSGPSRAYGTRAWRAHGAGPSFYGMELEMASPSRRAWQIAYDNLGEILAEAKPDGSLLEITTHPLSYPYFMARYPWKMLGELELAGAVGDPRRAGIHIHVNKDGFENDAHIYNWQQLYYRNRRQSEILGGRPGGLQYGADDTRLRETARYIMATAARNKAVHAGVTRAVERGGQKFFRDDDKAAIRAIPPRDNNYGFSGTAIDNYRHSATFEVRFPGSSLEAGKVKTRLQLIAGGVEYARQLPDTRAAGHDFARFYEWVKQSRRYPQLAASIKRLSLA